MGQDIRGKIAYITGAGSGIGRSTALEFAKEGVHVGLIARTESKLQEVAEEAKALGVHASYAVCDISEMEQVDKAVASLQQNLGGMTEALMQEVRRNNIRVFTLNPSLVATELAFGDKLDDQDKEKFMQPEDMAEYMVSQLKLHPRIFIKQSLQWATNPF